MSDQTINGEGVRFGEFCLNVPNQELRRGEERVKLAPQPFQVLALLVEHARRGGGLVTREEIERAVWGDGTVVDFRQGVNSCILQLREALGDDARSPHYIETVPRRGYRFIAPVQAVAPAATTAGTPPLSSQTQRAPIRWLGALAVLAVVALSAAFVGNRGGVPPAQASSNRVLIAVLPFEDLSGTASAEPFTDGLTDEVIALLGRPYPDQVGVIARTTAMQYKGTGKDVQQIGRELGVAYVIEGSVRRQGSHARITAQLVRVSDQAYLWCQSWERELAQPLEVQKEIGARVADAAGFFLVRAPQRNSLARLR